MLHDVILMLSIAKLGLDPAPLTSRATHLNCTNDWFWHAAGKVMDLVCVFCGLVPDVWADVKDQNINKKLSQNLYCKY